MIQPNPFPLNLIVRFLDDYKDALSDEDTFRTLLRYEKGFLVCAVIGILYIVLMPVIGGVLACCYRRGNWGGRMYQRQTSSTNINRRALYWSVFITTAMVLLGNIYMFMSNAAFNVNVDQIDGTLNVLHAYFTAVPRQVNESYKIVDEMSGYLHTIGCKLGMKIHKRFESGVYPALGLVGIVANSSHYNTTRYLNLFHLTLLKLVTPGQEFSKHISEAIKKIGRAKDRGECLVDSCHKLLEDCLKILKSGIYVKTFEFGYIRQSLRNFQSALEAVKWDSTTLLEEEYKCLENIPQNVNNDTKDIVQHMKNKLEDIKTHISKVNSDVLISVSTNVTDTLQQLQRTIHRITPGLERAEHITRAVVVVLCCMVLLVVVCNILGVVLGPLGVDPKADPKERSGTAHYGGNFLLTSAGFIFLFSWLLMVVVLLLFVLGGNIYALVCKPWHDGELLQLIDSPDLIGFELGSMLGLKSNLPLTDVYTDCQKNMSLWSTLHMNELIDLEEHFILFNVSQYTDVILSNINITPFVLLRKVEQDISILLDGAQHINFTAFTQHINMIHNITANLEEMYENIDHFNKGPKKTPNLNSATNFLEEACSEFYENIEENINELNLTTETLRSIVDEITETAQDFLDNYTMQIIKTENREFVDSQLGNITVTYAEWANLTQEVGRCEPLARAVDSVQNIVCENMVEHLNTFWFSLGLCLILFILSIIFSIKLAKYYRRMEESDRTVDNSNHLSEALQLIEIH